MTNAEHTITSRLILTEDIARLLHHSELLDDGETCWTLPIIARFFTPDANAQWVIMAGEVWENDLRLFGWCDLGLGFGELGYVLLSEIESLRGKFGLPVERDITISIQRHMTLDAWHEIERDT